MDKDHELAPPSLATQSSASGALEGNLGLENTRLRAEVFRKLLNEVESGRLDATSLSLCLPG